jgi:hypothetical protein
MKTIIANIPARKIGKITLSARTDTYIQDDDGRWSSPDKGPLTEAEVVDMAQRATNWKAIKAAHFPMVGFHS